MMSDWQLNAVDNSSETQIATSPTDYSAAVGVSIEMDDYGV